MLRNVKRYFYRIICRMCRICRLQNRTSSKGFLYRNPKILFENSKKNSELLLHRTLLWDNCEPVDQMQYICSVRKYTYKMVHLLWNGKAVEELMKKGSYLYYFAYPRKIMQADLARYVILYHYGGMYLDFDISMYSSLDKLFAEIGLLIENKLPAEYCILFEEYRWENKEKAVDENEQSIRFFMDLKYRTEALVRVANYAMICTPGHPFMLKVIEECHRRAALNPACDYDVLFMTGPDVVSHVYDTIDESFRKKNNLVLISQKKHDDFIVHHCVGAWRILKEKIL